LKSTKRFLAFFQVTRLCKSCWSSRKNFRIIKSKANN